MLTELSLRNTSNFPFEFETDLERRIAADQEWLAGLEWGKPRLGHPEGKVKFHIKDVLDNIDHYFGHNSNRHNLRLIALLHDTFKSKQATAACSGVNRQSHAILARRFAEKYIQDTSVLIVIELHDEAYKAFLQFQTDRQAADARIQKLITCLGDSLALFTNFYFCDSKTSGKSMNHYEWFQEMIKR